MEITEANPQKNIPSGIVGLIERFRFTLLVIVQPDAAPTATMGWLGLKMAANWNKDMIPAGAEDAEARKTDWSRHAVAAILPDSFDGLRVDGGMLGRLSWACHFTPLRHVIDALLAAPRCYLSLDLLEKEGLKGMRERDARQLSRSESRIGAISQMCEPHHIPGS